MNKLKVGKMYRFTYKGDSEIMEGYYVGNNTMELSPFDTCLVSECDNITLN